MYEILPELNGKDYIVDVNEKYDIPVKGLGVSLYHYLKENIQIETISILGISEIALGISVFCEM